MKQPKYTPWFPAGTKPERVGDYEVPPLQKGGQVIRRMRHWNGKFWSWPFGMGDDPQSKAVARKQRSSVQKFIRWRGMTEGWHRRCASLR